MTTAAIPVSRNAPLHWLALGAFAVGTEGFMIAAILPRIASDLSISIAAAGQIVTVFALSYAFSSPILTTLTGNIDRRNLLIFSMALFAVSNLVAASVPNYWTLIAARVLLAFSAGLYVPNANALAGLLVPPERRGRAIAIINGGLTSAIALGVPLGAVIGNNVGWRMTFVGVAVLASVALVGLMTGLPRDIGAGMTATSLSRRVKVLRQPGVLGALIVTMLWAIGGYTVYTYIAPLLAATVGLAGEGVGYAVFLWGLAAGIGLAIGGSLVDRRGADFVVALCLPLTTLALVSLSASGLFLSQTAALVPVMAAIGLWGASHWAFWPGQQSRLIATAGLSVAPVALSLNASFMYLGFSLGAMLGSFTLMKGEVQDLGLVGGSCILASFLLFLATRRK
ncbi:MAG TPA: MFS transporter [Aliidongia sp.]|nr:MFS transporter [Aliidongia sp.]